MNNHIVQGPIIYFDGVCKLCNRSVQFIIRHDKKKIFRFVTLQSEKGNTALTHFPDLPPDSIILFYNNQYYIKSEALLRIMKLIGGIWRLFQVFIIIPRGARDKIYDIIARNRYKWFGKTTICMLPPDDE